MPVLILLGFLVVWIIVSSHKACSKNTHPYSHDELEQMLEQMVGKSEKDCKKILKHSREQMNDARERCAGP